MMAEADALFDVSPTRPMNRGLRRVHQTKREQYTECNFLVQSHLEVPEYGYWIYYKNKVRDSGET